MSTQQPAVAPGKYDTVGKACEAEVFAFKDGMAWGRWRNRGSDHWQVAAWSPTGRMFGVSGTALDLLLPPAVRPWSGPADVPMPGPVWMRRGDASSVHLLIAISENWLTVGDGRLAWDRIDGWQYSTDGRTFGPCTVEGE